MSDWLRFGNVALPILYGGAFLIYLISFLRREEDKATPWTNLLPMVCGFHLVYLASRGWILGHLPLFSRYESMSFVAFALSAIYLAQERHVRARAVGVFILGPAFLLQIVSSLGIQHVHQVTDPRFQGVLFRLHVLCAILAYVAFAVAAFYGALFLLLFGELRSRRLSSLFSRLPALETLSRMNYRAVLLAFILFTFGIVAGTVWSFRVLEDPSLLDPKQVGALIIWLLYGVLLLTGGRGRWQGRRGAILSLVGFGAVLLLFLVLNVIFPTFHNFL